MTVKVKDKIAVGILQFIVIFFLLRYLCKCIANH